MGRYQERRVEKGEAGITKANPAKVTLVYCTLKNKCGQKNGFVLFSIHEHNFRS